MSARDIAATSAPRPRSIRRLLKAAGRAGRAGAPTTPADGGLSPFEQLESRVMLSGDHPSFDDVFVNGATATLIALDGGGAGAVGGIIDPSLDNDVLRFTAPQNDFVRVWADALNSGNALDSTLQVYTRNTQGDPVLVASGSNNGTLTTGVFKDGWIGFKAEAGREYFVQVRGELGTTGNYTVRVNALSTGFPALNPATGLGTAAGSITLPGSDIVYAVTTGNGALFDSLLTINATADATDFDTRLDLYASDGTPLRRPDNSVVNDSDTGNLSNSFLAYRASRSTLYYVRVRSDQVTGTTAAGNFSVRVDSIGTRIVMDPATRLGGAAASLPNAQLSDLYVFQAQGTGLSFVTVAPTPLPPLQDSAIRIYSDQGILIGFNELPSAIARIAIGLQGGLTYYAVVENFDGSAGGVYSIAVEAHHTFKQAPAAETIDDHVNTPTTGTFDQRRRQFELATPIVWGPPVAAPDPSPLVFPGLVTNPPLGNPALATDHSQVLLANAIGRVHAPGDTDLFQFVPPVDMLGDFEGYETPDIPQGQKTYWQRFGRPASRLQILAFAQTLNNATIRVLDSNLEEVYELNNVVRTGVTDPAGMLDPASFPPTIPVPPYTWTWTAGQPAGIEVWGGEVYYLEVTGIGSGRYSVQLQVDADQRAEPFSDPVSQFYPAIPGAGNFATAKDIPINEISGDGSNYNNAENGGVLALPGNNFLALGGNGSGINLGRGYAMNLLLPAPAGAGAAVNPLAGGLGGNPGSKGRIILQQSDFAAIKHIGETHLYKFRALYTGATEVRINTTNITDEYWEAHINTEDGDPLTPPEIDIVTKTKTLSSPLDSALRIFDNDFQQLVYNNDNEVTAGEYDVANTGASFLNRQYHRRDARAIFHVEAGKTYYVQVESGQAPFAGDLSTVDWRHALGGYEMLINSMSNLDFVDDHVNQFDLNQATPIPIDLNIPSTTATLGFIDGEIDNVPSNPADSDLFFFVAPASGTARISVTTREGDLFGRQVTVIDAATTAVLGQATATGSQAVNINVLADQGRKFFVVVQGGSGTDEGRYRVSVSGVPARDDLPGNRQFGGAFVIDSDLYDFDRTETVTGSIEHAGDSDVFAFDALTFDSATLSVRSLTATLSPFVRVYEVSEDDVVPGVGKPILLQVGFGAGTAVLPGTTTVSLTAPPRTSTSSGNSYRTYYVVVSGVNPDTHKGDYELTLTMTKATDDHPDENQFTLTRNPEDTILIGPSGTGGSSGVIELSGDTDLFQFSVGAGGIVTVNAVSPTDSTLFIGVSVFDAGGESLVDIDTGNTTVVGPDVSQSVARFRFAADRNATYFVLIRGLNPGGNTFKTSDTGNYLVNLGTPVPDDHPNEGEFPIATEIAITPANGLGAATGIIEVVEDTDLFRFTALGDGNARITIDTPGSNFTPALRLFDGSTSEIGGIVIDGDANDEDGLVNGSVTRTISVLTAETYYVLVLTDLDVGGYTVTLQTPRPQGVPADDHANAGQWELATLIPLSPRTGDGTSTGVIELTGDTDLFFFTSLSGTEARPRKAFVQIVTPTGSFLDVSVKVFGPAQNLLATDVFGGPGFNAGVTFDITGPNLKYFIEVDGLSGTGGYTVRVDTAPETYTLFYPEGFANDAIREFVSIGNANDFDVTYTVRLRFEGTGAELVAADNWVVKANSRGGITISDGINGRVPGLAANAPYSIVIESDGFLAANISHYDFGSTLGEAFTSRTSTSWSFPKGERGVGTVRDFVIFYNPNDTASDVTLTVFRSDGQVVSFTQTVQANRRGGWNLSSLAPIGPGQFAFTVTSAPATPGDAHFGVVAALSHYDLVNNTGYGTLGDPDGGAATGVIPGLMTSDTIRTAVTMFNPGASPVTVNIVSRYINAGLPDVIRSFIIEGGTFLNLAGADLGLTDNQLVGLRYDATGPISVVGGTIRPGSTPPNATTDVTHANTEAATSWFFGDGFMNRIHAGNLYFENLYFYNPDVNTLDITLKFVFNDGYTVSTTIAVDAKHFGAVALHELAEILNAPHPGGAQGPRTFSFFAVEASANLPFAAKMNHYDLVLDGAWGTRGAALGLTTSLSNT
ncbi:MAG: hypothetical protein WD749_09790 [Phycisphaerales bacterium]